MLRSYTAGHSSKRELPGPGAPTLKTMKLESASRILTWISSDWCIEKVFYLRKYNSGVKCKPAKTNELELQGDKS